ncbi:redox-regulated ATPase YchF [Spiroplasma endosymbiont of Monopis laevigella]|uniref:redox-regulated ATPase YchF n=1 Tax=Spiroplasma endosymbiont of Monopis laevigella TaxID=3066312 RepID=UPI0030D3471F
MLTVGIVGLPNVGKSTLFKAITNSQVLIENYPFATIKPNIGSVPVNDSRILNLIKIFNPQKVVPTILELHDIAGLVKGASKGEGLGNQFLANIRTVDAICEVIRCFDDINVTHVENKIDPINDFEIIELELMLADQEVISKRKEKVRKKSQITRDKQGIAEVALLEKINNELNNGIAIRNQKLSSEELLMIKPYNFLTAKPIIVIANINEKDLITKTNKYVEQLQQYMSKKNITVIVVCAKTECELSELEAEEKKEMFKELNIFESGIDQIVLATYKLLNLGTYFTVGPKEVHAWTFIKGMKAPECAGIIHTDFMKGFIRLKVYNYQDIELLGSEKNVQEKGKMRVEGKNYIVEDGDICHFLFNV